ncbi:MAG: DUF4124 domain-containing protein [Gammaproteobacteria bacterium]
MTSHRASTRGNASAIIALAAALAVLLPAGIRGEIYKWVDAQGHTHYAERPGSSGAQAMGQPPVGTDAGHMPRSGGSAAAQAADRMQREQRLLKAFEEERRERTEKQAKQRAEAQERTQRCAAAKDGLYRVRHAGYLYERDAGGERRILSDGERASAEQSAQEAVEHWCG